MDFALSWLIQVLVSKSWCLKRVLFRLCTHQVAQAVAEHRDAEQRLPKSGSEASENQIRP